MLFILTFFFVCNIGYISENPKAVLLFQKNTKLVTERMNFDSTITNKK